MLIYKYFSPDRTDFFDEFMVRFTQPSALNDPFECLPRITDKYENLALKVMHEELRKIGASFNSPLDQKDAEIILVNGTKQALLDHQKAPNEFDLSTPYLMRRNASRQIGIFSASRCDNNVLLWSHYSDQHRGFAVAIQTSHDFFRGNNTFPPDIRRIKNVLYRDLRPEVNFENKQVDPDFVFTKSLDWEYEQEVRLVRPLHNADKKIEVNGEAVCLFSLPPTCIKHVIFGIRATSELKNRIATKIKSNLALKHVKFFHASADPQRYIIQKTRLLVGAER